jgi:hypothetical protein
MDVGGRASEERHSGVGGKVRYEEVGRDVCSKSPDL